MRRIPSRFILSACCLALLAPPAFAQRASDLGMLNRLYDETQRRDDSFATVRISFEDGTLSSVMEKYVPTALLVRAELEGQPVKLSRGKKPKVLEGLTPGTLVISVERPLHGTRQRAECIGFLSDGLQEVLIYPQGDVGVDCRFYDVGAGAVAAKEPVETLPPREIPDWELALSFESFAAVGGCHNDHEAESAEFRSCVEAAGVRHPAAGDRDTAERVARFGGDGD